MIDSVKVVLIAIALLVAWPIVVAIQLFHNIRDFWWQFIVAMLFGSIVQILWFLVLLSLYNAIK